MAEAQKEALHRWLRGEGFRVVEFKGDGTLWGYTSIAASEVGLWSGLREFQVVPTLLHECLHVYRRDEGHQSQVVEQKINERVALLLIDPGRYQDAEERYGWHCGGIAADLGLPRWVVSSYRAALRREGSEAVSAQGYLI